MCIIIIIIIIIIFVKYDCTRVWSLCTLKEPIHAQCRRNHRSFRERVHSSRLFWIIYSHAVGLDECEDHTSMIYETADIGDRHEKRCRHAVYMRVPCTHITQGRSSRSRAWCTGIGRCRSAFYLSKSLNMCPRGDNGCADAWMINAIQSYVRQSVSMSHVKHTAS